MSGQEAVERPGEVEGMECPEDGCDGSLELRESKHGLFYGCTEWPDCDATHGAHPDGRPLGVPADKPTKRARMRAHEAFDPLWRNAPQHYDIRDEVGTPEHGEAVRKIQKVARVRCYRWLAHRLRMDVDECHIGMFDAFTCELVVKVCRGVRPDDVRRWYKGRQVRAWRRGRWPDGREYEGKEFTEAEAARWE